ncbi:rhodanese-like domain-containing protein [Pengzhenrongella sicca]|uniref:Rhodanese-like domain-containing protein n=1 Tax=Pengzhenrongella sicca TaxID=2819238 RepID=A0A8A4ZF01_9MICO|nr:rhodanese-like domain-containing protein [Pengzhenrongella sicca]QTE29589.1 rhodanese-like domain-containing protein [Pengzhenrongella sicca]
MFPPQVPAVHVADLDPAAPVPAGTTLLDVRERDEWDAGHAPGALHVPLGELVERVGELPAGAPLLVVCHSGARSARATAWLNESGYSAENLDGGMVAWSRAGLPVV